MSIRVAVSGAAGRMGREARLAIGRDADLDLVGAIDLIQPADDLSLPWDTDAARLFAAVKPQVVVDFSAPSAVPNTVRAALDAGVSPVIGTSGVSDEFAREIEERVKASGIGAALIPNFAIGAVLMMYFAGIAGRYFDSVEIVEAHHDQKIDSPSGTAIATAQILAAARGRSFVHNNPEKESLPGGRGSDYEGVAIHSLRLPGLVANQDVIFGALGQTLTISHHTTSRESFMPGVILAVKAMAQRNDFVFGLGTLLGLE